MRTAHHEKDRLRRSEQYYLPAAAAYQERGLDRGTVGRHVVDWQPYARATVAPLPGVEAAIITPEGADYGQRVPGRTVYFSGDAAAFDEDGYLWFSGRADEIIKIAGHRIGTIEVETAFLRHPAVAEAGVTGRPDDL